jgi:hypothetical protein
VDGEEQSQPLRVEEDPSLPPGVIAADAPDADGDKDEVEREKKEKVEKRAKRIDY